MGGRPQSSQDSLGRPASTACCRNSGVVTEESDAYEELTRDLVERLGVLRGVSTVRLERNVVIQGKATHHQTDVIWQFKASGTDQVQTVLFECRHYKDAIKKGRLLEFKGVVDDIAAYDGPGRIEDLSGTMVTLSRYQIAHAESHRRTG